MAQVLILIITNLNQLIIRKIFLMVARIIKEKGILEFIDAVNHLKKIL